MYVSETATVCVERSVCTLDPNLHQKNSTSASVKFYNQKGVCGREG